MSVSVFTFFRDTSTLAIRRTMHCSAILTGRKPSQCHPTSLPEDKATGENYIGLPCNFQGFVSSVSSVSGFSEWNKLQNIVIHIKK